MKQFFRSWFKGSKAQAIDDFMALFRKELSALRSDILHPYYGVKIKAYLDTVNFIETQMPDAMMCLNQNELFNLALSKMEISGMAAEFGVKSGKTINKLATKEQLKKQIIHGFDSFVGLPEDWSGNRSRAGKLSNLGKLPKVAKNVRLHQGWFKDVLPDFLAANKENFNFIHIDCDLYSSTKDVLTAINSRIISGTVIMYDEFFNYPNWRNHEYKAFMEFAERYNIKFQYLGYANTQVAIKII
jgi:hypothetical protein